MTVSTDQAIVNDGYFPGHQVDAVVFYGDPTRIYRARRRSNDMPVMLKTLRDERSAREAAALLKHEYEMARRLNVPGVIQVFSLERCNNLPVIELEDFGGDSLDNIASQRRLPVEELLNIAIQLAQGLVEIHAANIIHKDINPSNIVYNPETAVAKIIDFGISTNLTREQAALANAEGFEGSLPYISPEQTGRMNRSIDYRSDFYSFGVTLYELLTGRPLFVVSEPIEWFHCHIAKQPNPPVKIDPAIPGPLSDIVMKLLAKTAEDRYQSAQGIRHDLQQCYEALKTTGAIKPFALAVHDISDRFQIPQRLYGRENEVARLLASFEEVGSGKCKMMLVSGYSGIGKTCLIKEIYKPITQLRGRFITGKFDQLHRNIPYSALAAALRDLVRQLLTEPEAALAGWRTLILDAVGHNGQLIIDIIHELELIIGPQPPVAETSSPLEAEQRFHRVFLRFVDVFCAPHHPLAIFLDDLQWADSASMQLLDLLSSGESGTTHLLLIGAYRDNEVQATHPVALWLKTLRERDIALEEIGLQPLNTDHLIALLADTLGAEPERVDSLAQIIEQKTGGNPFFTEEFLKTLHQMGLIVFSHAEGRWTWDINQIQAQGITDNVVALMTTKLERLAPETRDLLKLGACIGFRFALSELAVVSETHTAAVAAHLREAITEGLIAPLGEAYQLLELEQAPESKDITVALAFAHDRIHQAAYALLDEDQRCQAHLKIGRRLRHSLTSAQQQEYLFEIANHLNLGSGLIADPAELTILCRLNLNAGKRAKSANAYQPAFDHLQMALKFLDARAWQTDYALALEIHNEAAGAAYLNGAYEEMDRLLDTALANAVTLHDKVPLFLTKISACMARGELLQAINIAKPVLAQLGHVYPAIPKKRHLIVGLLQLKWCLRNKSMDDLLNLSEMTDPNHLAAMSIGQRIGGAAMFAQPELLPLMVFNGVKVSVEHGHAPESLTTYAAYGMILAESLGEVDRGVAFGRLGLELMPRLNAKRLEGRVQHVYNTLVRHWKEPINNCLDPLHEAFLACLEQGDFEYAAHAVVVRLGYAFNAGQDLMLLRDEIKAYLTSIKPLKQGPRITYLKSSLQVIDNLIGNSEEPSRLRGRFYDMDKMMPIHKRSGDKSLVGMDSMNQVLLYYYFGHYEDALAQLDSRQTTGYGGTQGMYFVVSDCFLSALVRLANFARADKAGRKRLTRQIAVNLKKIKRWAKSNPANILNKLKLIQAEQLRVSGQDFKAHELYDASIELAREQGFIHEQALANELCGAMHSTAGRMTLAEPYLAKACDLYRHWGALAKVADLEKRYPRNLQKVHARRGSTTSWAKGGSTTTWGTAQKSVDIGSLIKALKAIAEESVHSRMVEIIIATALEFAGAQQGMLMLRNPGGLLCIEAEASVDGGEPRILQSIPATAAQVPQAVINYVGRTCSSIVIHDAQLPNEQIPGLNQDQAVVDQGIRSLLCLPILNGRQDQSELIGMLYLENNRASNTFTQERFDTLEIICLAAAGRLELSRKAIIDGLTQLYNHDYFQNILSQEFISARRHDHDLSLILIDIDHFKRFNDTWGHQVGDQVLKEVAHVIKASCRSGDTVARYGGEEMAVILPLAKNDKAEMVAERIRTAVAGHRVIHNEEQLSVTISLGLAIMNRAIEDKDALIRCADTALYRSKAEGRNRVTVG